MPRRAAGTAAAALARMDGLNSKLRVNPIACTGHGMCAELLPELITLDPWGYPLLTPRRPVRAASRPCQAGRRRLPDAGAAHDEARR